jgi:hypothetical protein
MLEGRRKSPRFTFERLLRPVSHSRGPAVPGAPAVVAFAMIRICDHDEAEVVGSLRPIIEFYLTLSPAIGSDISLLSGER